VPNRRSGDKRILARPGPPGDLFVTRVGALALALLISGCTGISGEGLVLPDSTPSEFEGGLRLPEGTVLRFEKQESHDVNLPGASTASSRRWGVVLRILGATPDGAVRVSWEMGSKPVWQFLIGTTGTIREQTHVRPEGEDDIGLWRFVLAELIGMRRVRAGDVFARQERIDLPYPWTEIKGVDAAHEVRLRRFVSFRRCWAAEFEYSLRLQSASPPIMKLPGTSFRLDRVMLKGRASLDVRTGVLLEGNYELSLEGKVDDNPTAQGIGIKVRDLLRLRRESMEALGCT